MDPQASSQFIASLIKSIQVVCHGNVEFNHNIEIVGHIYLHVDKCQKFNYVLNEEVVKDSESTKFVSNSFPAEPPSREPDRKRRKVATPSSVTESDGATDLITISNDADELSSRLSHPPVVSSASPTVVVPSTPASNLRHRPRRPSFPANQSALSSSESERTPPPRTIATSQSQTLSQPQTRVPGPGVLLDPEVKPDVSGQTATSLSHPPSSRDSYVSSDPSLSGAGAAVITTPPTTSEPDIQIKLEVPSEEEVQLLSHDIAGQVRGSSHPSHSVDPNSSPGSGSLYPVMLHQNLAATHTRDSGALSGSRAKRQHLESDIPVLSSAYSIGQDDFNLHSSNLPGSSNKQPGSQWNHPPQRMLQDPPNDGIAEPMVHFDTSLMGPRLSGGPTSTVTSMAQDSSSGSLEARDAQRVLADCFIDSDDGAPPIIDVDSYEVDDLLYPFPPAETLRHSGQGLDQSGLNAGNPGAFHPTGRSQQQQQPPPGPSIQVSVKKSKWDRRHYCPYCQESHSKLSRHLMLKHREEVEVQEILNLPKGSRERWLALLRLQRKGDYLHNVMVIQRGEGEIMPTRRRRTEMAGRDFAACQHCYSFMDSRGLAAHELLCVFRPKPS